MPLSGPLRTSSIAVEKRMGYVHGKSNILAGLSVAGLVLPESIAYASIAGLPPIHALGAALAGLVVYPLVGRSRFAIVSPTSASAAVLAASFASAGAPSLTARLALLGAIVALVGILFVAAGLLRFGFAAAFVARPVLRGFAIGLGASIVLRQFFAVTGVHGGGSTLLHQLAYVLQHASEWNLPALAIALPAVAILLLLKTFTRIPAAFGVLVLGVILSFAIDLQAAGIPVVGHIALTFPMPLIPQLDSTGWLATTSAALPLGLLIFVESWGTCRSLALRHGDILDPNRELIAIGLANIAAASIGGQTVGAGFSASSANENLGATSRAAGVFAAFVLAAMMAVALPLIARVPTAILAAVVVAALAHALDPRPLLRLWRLDRDQYVALIAALGVLLLGVLYGMLLAVVLSVLAIIRRLAEPAVDRLGQLDGSSNYVDIARHPEAATEPGIVVVRPNEPLFFANAERIMTRVEAMADPDTKVVVLSLELSDDLDSTSLEVLDESATRLNACGRTLQLGRVKDPVRDLMELAGGILSRLAEQSCRSVAEAVAKARAAQNSREDL
jgi:MFS superfamily sulfate permease-like transporter